MTIQAQTRIDGSCEVDTEKSGVYCVIVSNRGVECAQLTREALQQITKSQRQPIVGIF